MWATLSTIPCFSLSKSYIYTFMPYIIVHKPFYIYICVIHWYTLPYTRTFMSYTSYISRLHAQLCYTIVHNVVRMHTYAIHIVHHSLHMHICVIHSYITRTARDFFCMHAIFCWCIGNITYAATLHCTTYLYGASILCVSAYLYMLCPYILCCLRSSRCNQVEQVYTGPTQHRCS